MRNHIELQRLASLLVQRNAIDGEIAAVLGRPAHPGHIGEFVVASIFDITLNISAIQKGTDGHFASGALAGKSVTSRSIRPTRDCWTSGLTLSPISSWY